MNLADRADLLRQDILLRLEKKARGKAKQQPEATELGSWGESPMPSAQPAGSGTRIGFPSPNQVHPSQGDLSAGEKRIADEAQHGPDYAAGKKKADKEQHLLGDAMTPLASSAGRPTAEELDQHLDHPDESEDPHLKMAAILHGQATDHGTQYGQFLSQYTKFARKHVIEAAQLFRTLAPHAEAAAKGAHHISSLAPVFERMLEIRNELASGVPMGDHRNELIREYASHAENLKQLKNMMSRRKVKDAGVPFYPDDEGKAVDAGSAPPKFEADEEREGEEKSAEEKADADSQKKSRGPTQKAKDAKFGAAAYINSPWHDVLRSMRVEMAEDNYKQQLADARSEIKSRNLPKEVEDAEYARVRGGIIDVWRKKLNAYYKLEDILSSAEIGAHAITSAGDHGLKNFASWYTAGATRTMASIVDLINTSPAYKALRGKVGRIARFDPATGKEHENGTAYRLQFDSPEQAKAAVMIAALIGPTSANEKPSNNVRIALSLIEDGLFQFHRKYANDPERLAKGPSLMETLALARHDRGHLGIYSEFGHQQPYKYFSGLYHMLPKAEQLKHAKKFATLLFNESERGDLPSNEAIREKLLAENKGFYYRPKGSDRPALIPMKRAKVAGRNFKEENGPLSDYILAAQKLEPTSANRALVDDLLALAERKKPAADEPVFVGHESGKVTHGGKAALRLVDGEYQPLPKSISSRPGSARQFLSLMRMFQHGADVATAMPDASPEERKKAISAAILSHTDPETGKTLFDQLALSDATLKEMYGGVAGLKDANRRHADAIAEAIANSPGKEHDAIGSMFLAGVHEHPVLNKIIPVSHDSWFTGGDQHPYEGDYQYHANTNDEFQSKVPGMNVLGPKFGPYALGVSHPALQAMHHLMGGITLPDEKYVADRVMMELHSDALGRRFGGVPESEMQRAAFNHGVKHLGKVLGKLFGGGPLSIGKLQAITWGATQAAVSSLGGNTPTEQLYTGAERAWALHKVHAQRVINHYSKLGSRMTPEQRQLVAEYQEFLRPETRALRLRSAKDGIAYAMLQDVPYAGDQALGAEREAEQQRTLEGMSNAGKLVTAAFRDAGKKARHFSKGSTHDQPRLGDTRGVRADRGQNQRADGAGVRRLAAHSSGAGSRAGAPAHSLAGGAPRPAQRRGASPARRDGAAGGPHDVSAKAGAGPQRLKYSTQFMRAMLLGTSLTAQKFRQQLDGIAHQIGVRIKSYNGVGDGVQESAPATAHVSHQPVDPDTARYLGAWAGLLGDRRSVMVFHPDAKGTDSLYSVRLPLSDMQQVRAALDKYGLKHRTVIPGGKTTHVMVYDPRRIMRQQVEQLAGEHRADVSESTGRAEFLGRPANSGADAGESREHYRRIIADYEERRGVPNQAGAAANGGGSGPPVPGSSAAGRSPAGGSIVRGVTYKGGKFTPAAEQKGAPQQQLGSPERFRKALRLKYNKAKALAEQGASDYNPMLDAISSGSVLNPIAESHSPRNLGPNAQSDSMGRHAVSSRIGTPLVSDANSPPQGEAAMRHPSEATPGGLISAARKHIAQNHAGDPIELPTDIDALRHLVKATAGQGVSPYQRYAELLRQAPESVRGKIEQHIGELQKVLGTACAGNPALMEALIRDGHKPINHDLPLAPGVTPLQGTIALPPATIANGFIPKATAKSSKLGQTGDSIFIRHSPDGMASYGIVDHLMPQGDGRYYGTPDGHIFVDPAAANEHVMRYPHLFRLHGKVHEPWHDIMHRVDTYRGVDHVVDRLAGNTDLLAYERDLTPDIAEGLASGGSMNAMTRLTDKIRARFAAEPDRARALLLFLEQHLGGARGAPAQAHTISGLRKFPSGIWSGSVARTNPKTPNSGTFGQTLGAKRGNELTEMAARIANLFDHSIYSTASPWHLGVGSRVSLGPSTSGLTNPVPFDVDNKRLWNAPNQLDGKNLEPMALVGLSQMATPSVLAHEVMHAIEFNTPGVSRAAKEHAMAHVDPRAGDLRTYRGYRSPLANEAHFAPKTDMPWLVGDFDKAYAHVLNPMKLFRPNAQHLGGKRAYVIGNASNEYLPQMFGEFFTRPVTMARNHPKVVRFLFGLMNGALRSHQ